MDNKVRLTWKWAISRFYPLRLGAKIGDLHAKDSHSFLQQITSRWTASSWRRPRVSGPSGYGGGGGTGAPLDAREPFTLGQCGRLLAVICD